MERFSLFERLIPERIQYSIPDIYTPIEEMGNDLDKLVDTFFTVADKQYKEYLYEIAELLDTIFEELEPMQEGETVKT